MGKIGVSQATKIPNASFGTFDGFAVRFFMPPWKMPAVNAAAGIEELTAPALRMYNILRTVIFGGELDSTGVKRL